MNTQRSFRRRIAGISMGAALLSGLIVAGGATAAHAESYCDDEPLESQTEWGNGSDCMSGGPAGTAWVADQYQYSMTNYAGYDFYSRIDGGIPDPTDAIIFGENYNYSGGCVVPWWTDRLMCHD